MAKPINKMNKAELLAFAATKGIQVPVNVNTVAALRTFLSSSSTSVLAEATKAVETALQTAPATKTSWHDESERRKHERRQESGYRGN